jgi:hypothetical protein
LFRCDNCHSKANFTAIPEQIFLADVAITTAPTRAMLYDSPHAQEGLGQKLGGSVMAPQSDTSSLYVLICSLAGTVLSLAATWIVVAHSAQAMIA